MNIRWPSKFNEIPKEVFHREDVYRLELERIFMGPEWHMVAHRAELANPGDYKTFQIGEAPVLIVHGEDGKLRVFQNACPHRGTQLATCPRGSGRKIECPYHRWTFKNTGELAGIPGVADFPKDFRKEDYGLRELRSAEVYGIVFATFSADAPEIDEWLGETRPHIARVLGGNGELKLAGYQKMMFHANWKTCNDNDGYHGALLHTGYSHMDWSRGDSLNLVTASGNRVTSINLAGAPTSAALQDKALLRVLDTGIRPQTTVIAFYPSAGILRDLDVIYLRYIIPRGPDETEVHFAYFALATDGDALVHHRARQSANLMGISGLLAIEDAVAYSRGHVGSRTPGMNTYQKGLTGQTHGPCVIDAKGSEAANLIRWERYRQRMGFARQLGSESPA